KSSRPSSFAWPRIGRPAMPWTACGWRVSCPWTRRPWRPHGRPPGAPGEARRVAPAPLLRLRHGDARPAAPPDDRRDAARPRRAAAQRSRRSVGTTHAAGFAGAIRAKAFRLGREKDSGERTRLAESAVIVGQLCEENAPAAPPCDYWLAAALGLQARERT